MLDFRRPDHFTHLVRYVKSVQPTPGLGLELFEKNHASILSQSINIGFGRAFDVPEHAFKRATDLRHSLRAGMVEAIMTASRSRIPPVPDRPPSFLEGDKFRILCEIEPPRRPDLEDVREQIQVLNPVTDAFLVPDNHLGRATVSSVAVAHEVSYMSGRSIACLNARDRNLLGFRRDLLTAAAYGVDHFLFVYGDPPHEGRRAEDLTVRGMINEVHSYGTGPLFVGYPDFRIGTTARVGRPLTWRAQTDFLFVQVTYSTQRLVEWRETIDYKGRIYAGVLVLASTRMARRINATIPDIRVPTHIVDKLDDDAAVGLDLACEQIEFIRSSGAFDGVHLVPVTRYREMAERLAEITSTKRGGRGHAGA